MKNKKKYNEIFITKFGDIKCTVIVEPNELKFPYKEGDEVSVKLDSAIWKPTGTDTKVFKVTK
jgi:hypothetical protein